MKHRERNHRLDGKSELIPLKGDHNLSKTPPLIHNSVASFNNHAANDQAMLLEPTNRLPESMIPLPE